MMESNSKEESVPDQLKFKLCVLGDPSVGKTTLIHHFCEGKFSDSYLATIGVSFLTKSLELEFKGGKKASIVLQIWDIGGQSLFSQIRQNYLKGSQGAFVLFDVTSIGTLTHIDAWINELMAALSIKDLSKFPLIVLGNKIDLGCDDNLKARAKQYLQNQFRLPIPITYTSAKTGEGMNEAFEEITRFMIRIIGGL